MQLLSLLKKLKVIYDLKVGSVQLLSLLKKLKVIYDLKVGSVQLLSLLKKLKVIYDLKVGSVQLLSLLKKLNLKVGSVQLLSLFNFQFYIDPTFSVETYHDLCEYFLHWDWTVLYIHEMMDNAETGRWNSNNIHQVNVLVCINMYIWYLLFAEHANSLLVIQLKVHIQHSRNFSE